MEVAYRSHELGLFDAILFTTAKQTRLTAEGERPLDEAAVSLDAMLGELARALGEQGVAQQSGAALRRALLEALGRHGAERRLLLILDNLETLPAEDDLPPLFEFLRRLPQPCKAIVTSRRRAGEGAVWLRLEKLDWPAARDLIAAEIRRADRLARLLEPVRDRWRELYNATGGSPLALHWILGLMRSRNLSLDRALDLLRRAADEQGDAPLWAFIYREARQEMAADDWRVLGALSFFAAPASFEALAEVSGLARLALESALERLDAFALVDAAGPDGPYSLHPLTRQLAAAELQREPSHRKSEGLSMAEELTENFVQYWLDYAERYGGDHKDAYRTFDRLEAQWPNLWAAADLLHAMIEEAAPRGAVAPAPAHEGVRTPPEAAARRLNDLAAALSSFLWFRGYWAERVQLSDWAYAAAAAQEDWRNAGWRAYEAAVIHYYRAETEQAAAWSARCAAAWERGGGRREKAIAAHLRGVIAQQEGDLDEAERLYREALAAYRDLGEEKDEAIVLNDLGGIAQEREEYDRAAALYEQALAIDEKRGDKVGQAIRQGRVILTKI